MWAGENEIFEKKIYVNKRPPTPVTFHGDKDGDYKSTLLIPDFGSS
jgi:hypothetical protein